MMAAWERVRGFGDGSPAWAPRSGVRVVVGWWHESPFGPFADAMVERADGHRILLAPAAQVRDLVATTYVFDETRVEPFYGGAGGCRERWVVKSPSLSLRLDVGGRMPVGHLLRLVPRRSRRARRSRRWPTRWPGWRCGGCAPVGWPAPGRREFYGATDLRAVTGLAGGSTASRSVTWRPVDPPAGSASPRRRAAPRSPTSSPPSSRPPERPRPPRVSSGPSRPATR